MFLYHWYCQLGGYFICSTVQFDVAGDEWRDVLKERIMDQVMFSEFHIFFAKVSIFAFVLQQQYMTKTIYVWHFTDREILYAGRLCPLLQRGDNQIFSYEERNITNSWQSLKWSSRPSSSSPSSPSPPPSSSSPPPSPPGWPRRFQPVLLLLDRLHLLSRPDSHWQEQVSVIFFQHFINYLYLCWYLYLHFVCICIEILFPGWSGSARSLTRRSPSSKTSWMSVIVIVIVV